MKIRWLFLLSLFWFLPFPAWTQDAKPILRWSRSLDNREAPLAWHEGRLYDGNRVLDPATGKLQKTFYSEAMREKIKTIRFARDTVIFASESVANEEESYRSWDYAWDAFDVKSGKPLWQAYQNCRQPADTLLETCGNGRVLLVKGESADQLAAVDRRTGKNIWVQTIPEIRDVTAAGNRIFIQTEQAVLALSQDRGKLLWKTALPGNRIQTPALSPEGLFYARSLPEERGGWLVAVSLEQGKVIWKKEFPQADLFPPACENGLVFVISQPAGDGFMPGRLLALAANSGKEQWTKTAVTDYNGHDFQPVTDQDRLLCWCGDAAHLKTYGSSGKIRLLCLDPADGKTVWSYLPPEKEKAVYSRPLPAGDNIFFSDYEDAICIRVSARR